MRRWAIDMSPQGPVYLGYRLGHIRAEGRVFRRFLAQDFPANAVISTYMPRLIGAAREKVYAGVGFSMLTVMLLALVFASRSKLPRFARRRTVPAASASRVLVRRIASLVAGHEPFVVEPVEELAVVLGEPHDCRRLARRNVRQWLQLTVLRLLDVGVDRPPVWAPLGVTELLVDPLDHLLRECAAELVRVHVRLGGRIAHEVREQPLDHAVLAHHLPRPLRARLGEQRLLVLAALDQSVGLQPLQHLAGGGT